MRLQVELSDDADYRCQMSPTAESPGALSSKARLTVLVTPDVPAFANAEDLLAAKEEQVLPLPSLFGKDSSGRAIEVRVLEAQLSAAVEDLSKQTARVKELEAKLDGFVAATLRGHSASSRKH